MQLLAVSQTVSALDLAGFSGQDLLTRQDDMGRTPLDHACRSFYVDYHRKYRHAGALRSVQFIVGLGMYSQCELCEVIIDLVRMDPAGGVRIPLLGKEYYERALIQSVQSEEEAPDEEPAVSHQQLNEHSETASAADGTIWVALDEHYAASAGLRRASAATVPQASLSGRQLVRQWLEMAVVLPTEVRALILCHQRLALASVTHPRLSSLGQSTRNRASQEHLGSRLPQQSPAALLSIDLVGQVSESFRPECRKFAEYAVCWRLLLDARLGWTPTVGAHLQAPLSQ
jgi:hypothetical protein